MVAAVGVSFGQGPYTEVEVRVRTAAPPPPVSFRPAAPPVQPARVYGSGCVGRSAGCYGCQGYAAPVYAGAGCSGYQARYGSGCYGSAPQQPIGYVVERVPTGPVRRFFRGY
jgi:hypothetical protein